MSHTHTITLYYKDFFWFKLTPCTIKKTIVFRSPLESNFKRHFQRRPKREIKKRSCSLLEIHEISITIILSHSFYPIFLSKSITYFSLLWNSISPSLPNHIDGSPKRCLSTPKRPYLHFILCEVNSVYCPKSSFIAKFCNALLWIRHSF